MSDNLRLSSGGAANSIIGLMQANNYMGMSYIDYLKSIQEGVKNEGLNQQLGFGAAVAAGDDEAKLCVNQAITSGFGAAFEAGSAIGTTYTSYTNGNEIEALQNKQDSLAGFTNKLNERDLAFKNGGIDTAAIPKVENGNFVRNAKLPATQSTDPFEALRNENPRYADSKNALQRRTGQSEINFENINSDINNISINNPSQAPTYMESELNSIHPDDSAAVKKGLQQHSKNYSNQIELLNSKLNSTVTTIRAASQAGNGIVNAITSGLQAQIQKAKAKDNGTAQIFTSNAQSLGQGTQMLLSAQAGLLEAMRNNSQIVVTETRNDTRA